MLFRRTQVVFTADCARGNYFHVGAGIVADSNPEAEYEETLAKAAGFLAALNRPQMNTD
jgi:anthranilate/para-aminobenzoate synthase component I